MHWSGESVLFRVNKLWCVTLLLFAVSSVNAVPTTSHCSSGVDYVGSVDADVRMSDEFQACPITAPADGSLAAVAAELLQPPTGLGDSPAPPVYPKSLPAVPGTFFLVLTGFLCVSFVKDRRVWLAALAGLLWISQSGIGVFPELVVQVASGIHSRQQPSAQLTCPLYLQDSCRPRSDVEGSQYMGLLRHLAGIPHARSGFRDIYFSRLIMSGCCDSKPGRKVFRPSRQNTYVPQFAAIVLRYKPCLSYKCLASRAEQLICFSPAFIFDSLARGPPELT